MSTDNNKTPTFGDRVRRFVSTGDPRTFTASYKPPVEEQVKQGAEGEAWWRDFSWEEYATKYLPGLGLGFSVAGERYTVIRINGEIQLRKHEELFECYQKKNGSFEDKGYEIVDVTNDNIESLSYYSSKAIWDKVRRLFRHPYDGKLLTMRQGVGETKVTPNHSVYDESGNVVLSQSNPSLFALRDIPKRNILSLPYDIGVSYLPPYTEKAHIMPNGGTRQRTYNIQYKVKRVYDERTLEFFARFLGAWASEGFVHVRKKGNSVISTIGITNSDKEWLESIKIFIPELFENYSAPAIRIAYDKKSHCYSLRMISNDLSYVLTELCGVKSKDKRVPNFIFNSPLFVIENFLNEYSYGDGDKKLLLEGRHSSNTISNGLASGISLLFAILGKQFTFKNYHTEANGEIEYTIYETASLIQYYPTGDKHTLQAHYHKVKNYRKSNRHDLIEIPFKGFVYDLETSLSHNFVDACGLIVTHNTVYPYVAVWEKIWGAVPTEDYIKYKEYTTKDPFIRGTIDLHTMMAVSQGFEIDYPLDVVVNDLRQFLSRHGFVNMLKIVIHDMLTFGNSYTEIVRVWNCPYTGHDLEQLRPSKEIQDKNGRGYWWTDRMDVAAKHHDLYPDHVLENSYGEVARIKPLDPAYMRVRRDAYGTILGYAQSYIFPYVTFLADEMMHIRYMPTSATYESAYGVSMLRPILYHEELLKSYEDTMQQIITTYLKPMYLVRVGNPASPTAEVRVDQFNAVVQAFSRRKPGTDLIIRSGGLVQGVEPISPPIDRLQTTEFWLKWIHNMRSYALSVPKFFVDPAGLNRACYSDDTKVLTENGWKYHNEVKQGEKVMLYDPKTGRASYEKPYSLYAYDYNGKMVHFKSRNTDLLVTPEHTIVYKKNANGRWIINKAMEVSHSRVMLPSGIDYESESKEIETIEVPAYERENGNRAPTLLQSVSVPMNVWLETVGYYLSEGGMDSKNHYLFTLGQSNNKPANVEKIRNALKSLPFHNNEYVDKDNIIRWNVNGKQLCGFISSEFGEGCLNKHIPSKYKNLPKSQLRILFDALMLGDGTVDKRKNRTNQTYYTTSEQLSFDVLEIALKLGYSGIITKTIDKRPNRSPIYRVQLSKPRTKYVQDIVEEDYKGKVYCFSTRTGFYVTMRNGKIALQGNTAIVVQEAYFTFIQSLRQSLSEQIENQLFPTILRSLYGELADDILQQYGNPKLIWKPVKEESLADKAPIIINLLKAKIINVNEARTQLGLKPLERLELETGESSDIGGVPMPRGDMGAPPEEGEGGEGRFPAPPPLPEGMPMTEEQMRALPKDQMEEEGTEELDRYTEPQLDELEDWIYDMRRHLEEKQIQQQQAELEEDEQRQRNKENIRKMETATVLFPQAPPEEKKVIRRTSRRRRKSIAT